MPAIARTGHDTVLDEFKKPWITAVRKILIRQNPATPSALSGFWRCPIDRLFPKVPEQYLVLSHVKTFCPGWDSPYQKQNATVPNDWQSWFAINLILIDGKLPLMARWRPGLPRVCRKTFYRDRQAPKI